MSDRAGTSVFLVSIKVRDYAVTYLFAMQHRHLNHQEFSLAGVDDIIRRGGWRDWVALRRAAHRDPDVIARIQRLCGPAQQHGNQEGDQRLTFWRKYAKQLAATVG